MSLNFPNPSRSYDADRRRIRFWGHDSAMEVSFFLDENAIFVLYPKTTNSETGILAAFDQARERILAVALKVYAAGRQHHDFYNLTSDQFSAVATG
jgi:hypothetical protein